MAVLTLIMGGAIAVLMQGNHIIESARDTTRVSQVIQSQIEELRTMTWEDLQDLISTDTSLQFVPNYKTLALSGQFAEEFGDRYQLRRGVYFENRAGEDQIAAIVEVTWTRANGGTKKQSYYTRFTRNGLNDYYYRAF